ncbi:hypothetical protein FQN53_005087, partial [Emmonsiellopsis sp. PD_33]
ASLTLKPEDRGAGISMQNVAQIGGQVIALAVAGQIYQSTAIRNLSGALADNGFSEADIRSAVAGARSALFEKLNGELRDKAIVAVIEAMQTTFVLVPVAGGVVLFASLFMKWEKLFGTTNPKPTARQPFTTISRAIMEATESQELIVEDIDPSDGFNSASSLDETGEVERVNPSRCTFPTNHSQGGAPNVRLVIILRFSVVHDAFGKFVLAFEPTDNENEYKISDSPTDSYCIGKDLTCFWDG